MQATVQWNDQNGMLFVASTGSGHVVTMDGAPEGGGHNRAARPMELLLAGTGGCAAYDVVLILKRGRHAVEDCKVSLQAERAESDPKVFTRIQFDFVIRGKNLSEQAVERAVKLSHDKYCSASAILGKTADISYTVSVENTAETDE